MNSEERELLERTLKLSLENNRILHKMQRAARWAVVWTFIKISIIVIPLVIGFIYLSPYFREAIDIFETMQAFRDQALFR